MRDEANHTARIEPRATPSEPKVCTSDIAHLFAVQQHSNRSTARGSRLHNRVQLAGSEWDPELARAFPEHDGLTLASPVAILSA
jgi:hypothetical protein